MEKRSNQKKILLMIMGIVIIIIVVVGVTYAFFNYTRTGGANTVRTGRIYFNHQEGTAMNLTNAFPINVSNGVPNNNSNVGSVTINVLGDTTYTGGIEYLVSAVGVNNTVGSGNNEKNIPISVDVSVSNNTENDPVTNLGIANEDYFDNRGGNTSIYKILETDTISEDGQLLVGYIAPGETGVDGNIIIKAYFDKDKVAISDTYPSEETDTNNDGYLDGTTSDWANDRVVVTTDEWNALVSNGFSFQIKVEANEGIWVEGPDGIWNATDSSCFTTRTFTNYLYNNNATSQQKNMCVSKMSEINDEDTELLEAFCDGTGTLYGLNFQNWLYSSNFSNEELTFFIANNIVIDGGSVIEITDYDEVTCGLNVVIPKKINNLDVVKTGYQSFFDKGLISVAIPNSIKMIDFDSFTYNQLTSVTIPEGVVNIGQGAFGYNQLTDISIPSSVRVISADAFATNKLTSVIIPNGVEYIYCDAFANNKITTVSIPSSVVVLAMGDDKPVFEYNPLSTVYVDMVNINYGAFLGNNIKTLVFGPHVRTIDQYAFSYNALTSLTIPNNVVEIASNAFTDNLLTCVDLPSTTDYESNSFDYGVTINQGGGTTCPTLTQEERSARCYTYSIANNTVTIQSYKNQCGYNVAIPSTIEGYNVTTIDGDAFTGTYYIDVTIPNSVTDLSKNAFAEVYEIDSVSIDVANIPSGIFYEKNVSSLTLGSNVRTIGDSAFYYNNLTGNLIIPNGVTTIESNAFGGNDLTSVTLPSSITSWSCDAFNEYVTINNQSNVACQNE